MMKRFFRMIFVGGAVASLCIPAFAFQMNNLDDFIGSNPYIIKVYKEGGGPTSAEVDVNSPEIGDCGAPDKNGKYKVSTCKKQHVDEQLKYMQKNYVMALMMMAEQFTVGMYQQMQILGTFFDAKEHLETQRDLSILSAQAHKDYHPSELMCEFGTGVRSVANAEERGHYNALALSKMLTDHYTNRKYSVAGLGYDEDIRSRIEDFKAVYCDPTDHSNGLWDMCFPGQTAMPQGADLTRLNMDIDYTATFSEPLTLPVDYTDLTASNEEKDLIALARHLYWTRAFDPADMGDPNPQHYQEARSIMARAALAHNSFTHIVGMKSSSPQGQTEAGSGNQALTGGNYLMAILRDFGLEPQDIQEIYGQNPSYFAQMEILTKKIYQHPKFYTNLYDKPANVDRINGTLEALQVMQVRDRYDSQIRREMLMAALLEDAIGEEFNKHTNLRLLQVIQKN